MLGASFNLHVFRIIFVGFIFLWRRYLDVIWPVKLHEVFGAVGLQNFKISITLEFNCAYHLLSDVDICVVDRFYLVGVLIHKSCHWNHIYEAFINNYVNSALQKKECFRDNHHSYLNAITGL